MVPILRLNVVVVETPQMFVTLMMAPSTPTHHRKGMMVVHLLSRNLRLTQVTTIHHTLPIHQHLLCLITTLPTLQPRRRTCRRTDHITRTVDLMQLTIRPILKHPRAGLEMLISNFMAVDLGIVLIPPVHLTLLHLILMITGITDIRRIPNHRILRNTVILITTTNHLMDNTGEDTTTVHTPVMVGILISTITTIRLIILTMTSTLFSRITIHLLQNL
mmetsp:Transcript_25562/g.35979  ORF Transcript_25562/g.35979 Transcript_25562/m.35979 type:complete len:218 (-) Transcript_25562:1273-1926(-)